MRDNLQLPLQKLFRRLNVRRPWALLAIFQIVLLLVLLLTPRPPVPVAFVVPPDEVEQWSSLVKEFHKHHSNIRISLYRGGITTDQRWGVYTSDLRNSELKKTSPYYDLVYMDTIWVPIFASLGWLADLSNLFSPEELEQFLKADIEAGTYQNKLYRIPFHSGAGVLYYRKDLLEKQGLKPPQTFQDLEEISQKLKASKLANWGYVWQGNQYEGLVATFLEVLEGYGGFWIDEKGNVGLDQEPALKAAKFLRDTIRKKITPPDVITYDEVQSLQKFMNDEVVFLRSWPYAWKRLNEDDRLRGHVGFTSVVHDVNQRSTPCQGGWGFGITKNSQHPEEARQVIQFFATQEVQRQVALDLGYLPSRRSLFNDPAFVQQYSSFPAFSKMIAQSVSRPAIANYNDVSQLLQEALSKILKKEAFPDPKYSAVDSQQIVENTMRNVAKDTRGLIKEAEK
ncbi:MAG: ABC transporter substrate-binding protein [Timaviella obliquedivisa GSE-PSE-MK23-08B]|jgi:multiple sugar transport system substrate-binding protein|nr:ABC transporter substrate-binding protein [Timaviella obliquedivisa GSE-PSE-MK23-08B]